METYFIVSERIRVPVQPLKTKIKPTQNEDSYRICDVDIVQILNDQNVNKSTKLEKDLPSGIVFQKLKEC